jgi:transcriptional regulator with XRE-family HTH domain
MGKGRQRGVPLSERELRFAALLVSLRQARRLTQAELAERAELSVDTVGRLERGTFSPSLETMFKLADGLQTTLGTIFGAFEICQRDGAAELADLLRRLAPEEIDVGLRVLAALVGALRDAAAKQNEAD